MYDLEFKIILQLNFFRTVIEAVKYELSVSRQ